MSSISHGTSYSDDLAQLTSLMNSTDYDTVFFDSLPNPERHIDRLYTQARLKGASPIAPNRAQILEIGCSTGINLIPQALLYPESSFLGVDISSEQIAVGRKVARSLNIHNICFEEVGIERLERVGQSFDYIICHGLYSWVSQSFQQVLLERIAHFLRPDGVAYLSYNTERGWGACSLVKGLLGEIGREISAPRQKIARARKLIEVGLKIAQSQSTLSQSRTMQLFSYLNTISDALLLHEYLNPHVTGVSASTLHQSLAKFGLQYFGDARPQRESDCPLNPALKATLCTIGEGVLRAERDDVSDLFQVRSFRSAIVVRGSLYEHPVAAGEQIHDLCFASPLVPVSKGIAGEPDLFMLGEDQPCYVQHPIVVEILELLGKSWPTPISGRSLGLGCLSTHPLREFLSLVAMGAIEVSFDSYSCATEIEHQPITSTFVRYRASVGATLITLKHEHFNVNVFERALLELLDGTRSYRDLSDAMFNLFQSGQLVLTADKSLDVSASFFEEAVEMALREFYEHGLLSKHNGAPQK